MLRVRPVDAAPLPFRHVGAVSLRKPVRRALEGGAEHGGPRLAFRQEGRVVRLHNRKQGRTNARGERHCLRERGRARGLCEGAHRGLIQDESDRLLAPDGIEGGGHTLRPHHAVPCLKCRLRRRGTLVLRFYAIEPPGEDAAGEGQLLRMDGGHRLRSSRRSCR